MITIKISLQSKLVLFMGAIITILSIYKYRIIILPLIQLLTFYFISSDIECKINGKCIIGSWIALTAPTFIFVIFILDYLNMFKEKKDKIKNLYEKIKKLK